MYLMANPKMEVRKSKNKYMSQAGIYHIEDLT